MSSRKEGCITRQWIGRRSDKAKVSMWLNQRTLKKLDAIAQEAGCTRTAVIDLLLDRLVNGFNAGVVNAVNGKCNAIHLAMALIRKGSAYLPSEVVRAAHVADEAARDVSGLVVQRGESG